MNSKSSNMGWGYELIAAICIFALGIAFAFSSFRQGDQLAVAAYKPNPAGANISARPGSD